MLRASALALAALAAVTAAPALSRDQDEPAVGREPDAQDVAMTPLNDLNLARDAIPAVLLTAVNDPYASDGVGDCQAIETAIAELDGALGPDMDVSLSEDDRLSTGRMAKSVVASFIPFRGIVREVSGAARQERAFRAAMYAGAVRRGFLKGLGQQRGCAYPARPAFARVAIRPVPSATVSTEVKADLRLATNALTRETMFVSQPVIQAVPSPRR